MLDLGAHPRSGPVLLTLPLGQRLVTAALLIREVAGLRRCLADELLLTGVGRVAIDPALIAVQQLRDRMLVMHVGRRGHHRVDQLCLAIHADVGLHAEIPLIALLGLAHLWIALPILVLGRGRRVDDRRIDDGAGAHLQAIGLKVPANFLEYALAQIMGFEQVAELADGGLVRGTFPSQVDAHEVAHRQRVVERFLDRRVGQVEPVLQEVDAQHPLQANRRSAVAGLRIHRFDQGAQHRPRHDAVHPSQKRRAARRLAVLVKATCRERHLFHRFHPCVRGSSSDMTTM